jgi:hypothetical protein
MLIIKTNKGEEILIDDEDFESVSQFTWYIHSRGYVVSYTSRKSEGGRKQLKLHRFITNCPDDKIIDHANRNKLDNRKCNLRITNHQMNTANSKPQGTRKYKGVHKHHNKWRALIGFNGKSIHLGLFDTPEKAAKTYNDKASELFGEFAKLNNLKGEI